MQKHDSTHSTGSGQASSLRSDSGQAGQVHSDHLADEGHGLDKSIKIDKKINDGLALQCVDLENKYLRALADYQNLMKRTAQEKIEMAKFANEQLLHEILPVYDNLKTSMLHVNDEMGQNNWLVGIKHVIRQFKEVLLGMGVKEIKTEGEKFDHNEMEAISEESTDDKGLVGLVARELKSGYKLNGKVILPARVVVFELKE